MIKFPLYRQLDRMDCGPTCLRMIAKYYGKSLSLQSIRVASGMSREGVSLFGISRAAEKIGFHTLGAKLTYEQLINEVSLPLIAHWQQEHFVVVYKIKDNKIYVADPVGTRFTYSRDEFCSRWGTLVNDSFTGIALLLEPTSSFYEEETSNDTRYGFWSVFSHLAPYKKLIIQLFVGLLASSLIQLILPFLTQSIVDVGIGSQNLHFIYLILIAQIALFAGRTTIEFIRSWILLHISVRLNLSILTDFFIKLMRLPMSFFDVKLFGDIMQRINDQKRIESFLTNSSLEIIFSLFNLFIFGFALFYLNSKIFLVFLTSSFLYSLWILLFLKGQRKLDFKRFEIQSKEQSAIAELVNGMQEIKLANAELSKRWKWEAIRMRLFKLNIRSLTLNQYQQSGAHFINEGKNIVIIFLSAKAVIDGQATLGTLISIQYIIGQLNSPIEQFITFIQSFQEANISLERLSEVHEMSDEQADTVSSAIKYEQNQNLSLRNVSFQYDSVSSNKVIDDITITIPEGKTSAIVGTSGSGKSTLLKLLLKFYQPSEGAIYLGKGNLADIDHHYWRTNCGVVSQDSFIFSDTIANNIALGDDILDADKLIHAIKVANIQDFIESLPLGLSTKIGPEGTGISQGQKQRILIARAVYKNPSYIFFDEATNALDTNNEIIIMNNLAEFFQGRTVLIVAHRLSTVRNADQIIVLDRGHVVEQGNHNELVAKRGKYFELVRNQLELGI